MRISEETQKSIRTWVLFVAGLIWTSYFAFYNPTAMNPYFMTLGAAALFGPSVINMWRSGQNEADRATTPGSGGTIGEGSREVATLRDELASLRLSIQQSDDAHALTEARSKPS